MKSVATRNSNRKASPMRILLIWTLVSGLLFGLAEFGEPMDDIFRIARNKMREHNASGQVVVVGIDNLSQQEVGDWPWPSERYAAMLARLETAGARAVYFDFPLNVAHNDKGVASLIKAMASQPGQVHIAANFAPETADKQNAQLLPAPELRNVTRLINTNVRTNGFNTVWDVPFSNRVSNVSVPSLAASIANQTGSPAETFPIDYAIRMDSLPYLSAAEVLRSQSEANSVRGKHVIIGTNATGIGNRYAVPGHGPSASVFVSAIAAETLLAGRPKVYGWWIPFGIAFTACALMLRVSRRRIVLAMVILAPICAILLPLALETQGYVTSIMPALVLLLGSMGHLAWSQHRQRFDERGMVNEVSGQPNLNALRAEGAETQDGLIAARIHNYAEAATALPAAAEKELVEQIILRLSLGNGGCKVYQGDEGIFMWLLPAGAINNVGDQLAGLSAIFRSPANVSGRLIDLGIAFGVDADPGRSIQSRMSSALLACQEAQNAGEHWRVYDPTKLEATEWRVTMLGELDAAIDNG